MASSKARSRNTGASGARPGAPATRSAARAPATPAVRATPTITAKPARQPAAAPAAARKADPSAPSAATAPVRPAVTSAPQRRYGPPLWLQITTLVLAILGLGVSAYETYAHYNGSHLAGCPTGGNGAFNCTAVITSSQSMVFGVFPVAVLGLAFYVFLVAIMTPWAWRMQRLRVGPVRVSVGWLRLVAMITGMGFVMYLIYAEVYQIGDICEYCTGVHIITFLLFCLTLVSAAWWGVGKPKAAD